MKNFSVLPEAIFTVKINAQFGGNLKKTEIYTLLRQDSLKLM